MKKVIRLDEPKEEKQPKPIELTHCYSSDGLQEGSTVFHSKDKVVYIGYCPIDECDMFSVIAGNGAISFWKGHLNDGVY